METKDYRTTFSREVNIKMADYISTSFLQEIVQTISRRMSLQGSDVKLSFSTAIGAKFETSSSDGMEAILNESKKYKRPIDVIYIKTGIIHKNEESDTHYSVELRIQRIENQFHGYLRVYAVAGDATDSQHVIDWGTGFVGDFESLNIPENELGEGNLVIDAKDGMVSGWTKEERQEHDMPQKVEVVNAIKTSPQKWSDKSNLLAVAGIIITSAIALITWKFFSNIGS